MQIELSDVSKEHIRGWVKTYALYKIDLSIEEGQFVSITGPSGSGKSTLLNIIGCLDNPTSGIYRLDGQEVQSLSRGEQARIRNQKIGFVFQKYNLLSDLTVLQNVELPLMYAGLKADIRRDRAIRALDQVGLTARVDHLPQQLSGGQQQRVAIARALVTEPEIVLADEPTGDLDTRSGNEIIELLFEINRRGSTVILVTHDGELAELAERTIHLVDGRIIH